MVMVFKLDAKLECSALFGHPIFVQALRRDDNRTQIPGERNAAD